MTAGAGSFTAVILAEIAPHLPPLSCCRMAMLQGMRLAAGDCGTISTSRLVSARAALAALHAEHIEAHVEVERGPRHSTYRVVVESLHAGVSHQACCRRSLLRGVFLMAGSIRRPDAPPHVEMTTSDPAAQAQVVRICAQLEIPASLAIRRDRRLVLVRSASAVGTLLSCVGAHQGRLLYEEGRVVREVRADVNRRLNAETANLHRSASAGVRQLEVVENLIGDPIWTTLSPALREAAELRLRHPEKPLAELAAEAGVSRSAMAGRLRRLLDSARDRIDLSGNVASGV